MHGASPSTPPFHCLLHFPPFLTLFPYYRSDFKECTARLENMHGKLPDELAECDTFINAAVAKERENQGLRYFYICLTFVVPFVR